MATQNANNNKNVVAQNSKSADYTLVRTDASKHILHPAADNNPRTFTIPANSSVPFPIGTSIEFINEINTVTIAITTDTLALVGTGATGSQTLAANQTARIVKVTSTKWWVEIISAPGAGAGTAASTTEALTGTDASKFTTPDALAALWEQGANIASSGTISIGEGGFFHVTGTTTITDIDPATDKAGRAFWLVFDGALILTHNASTLILPTGANITTVAGDCALFVSEGSDVVRCVTYNRRNIVLTGRVGSDTGYTSNATLADLITLTVPEAGDYDLELQFVFGNSSGGLKGDFAGTAGITNARFWATYIAVGDAGATPFGIASWTDPADDKSYGASAGFFGVEYHGSISFSSAGTFIFRAAQNTSTVETSTIYRGGSMKLLKG